MKLFTAALALAALLATSQPTWGQKAVGEWTIHLSYHNPTRCEPAGNLLYVVGNGGLYSYDKEDNSIRTYCKGDPLNDTDISLIGYNSDYRTLIIVYSNSNIDLLVNDEDVYHLPDYMNKTEIVEKQINHICLYRQYAYLSTASGVLMLNLANHEISNFYQLNMNIAACHVEQNTVYAAAPDGLYAGLLTSNLLDVNNWNKVADDTSEFLAQYHDVPMKEAVPEGITPDSPLRNYFFNMNFAGEKLLVAGGGHTDNRFFRPGTIMAYEDNTWSSFDEDMPTHTGLSYWDITCVVQDPFDPTRHFAGSAGEGIYEFRDGHYANWYSEHNSPLVSAVPGEASHNYVRVNGLAFDVEGNLWTVSCEAANHQVNVLKADDNTWRSFDYSELSQASNINHAMIDSRGWLWATSCRGESGGLFCLDYNGTTDNTTDDRHRFLTEFINQSGSSVKDRIGVYCIAEDLDGAIWIGTNTGPLILNNPQNFFDDDFSVQQILVPRNDGTNLADYLLSGEVVNAIAVDGANRKWLGTEGSGLYLISADGQETIHHFTTENSLLLSNAIESLAIHPVTGEVFIGTSYGLVSYQSDATPAASSFDESNVRAYPNPVRPDYNGVITVTGMMQDSDVKIVNPAGQLVYQGTSIGGQFVWDGRDGRGRRVSSGVYMVLAANADGSEGIVTKIVIIR